MTLILGVVYTVFRTRVSHSCFLIITRYLLKVSVTTLITLTGGKKIILKSESERLIGTKFEFQS